MSDIYSIIYNTLAALGYPVREQGTYAPGAVLPETHITYDVIDEPNNTHYDNVSASKTTAVRVFFYSKKPALKQSADQALKSIMLPAGFLRSSGRSIPFDGSTGHYGYVSEYRYYETEV